MKNSMREVRGQAVDDSGMAEWREVSLGDVTTLLTGHPFKSVRYTDEPSGTKLLRGDNIGQGKLRWEGVKRWPIGGETIDPTYQLRAGDVVLAMDRPWIEAGLKYASVENDDLPCFLVQRVACLRPTHGLAGSFLRYLIGDDLFTRHVLSIETGTAVPHISGPEILRYRFLCPTISEQDAIAGLLSSLDNKINLLHRQDQTLEFLAETLFRHWFLESEREDWDEKPLSGIASFLNGLACQKYPPENEVDKLPVLKIRELSNGITDSADWATSKVKPEYVVEAGDVIFAWSASLMVKLWDGEKCVLNQHLFKVTSDEFPKWFYLRWCKHHLAEFIAISASHATTMGHIKRGDLDAAMVLVPPPHVLETMSQQMKPLLDKQIEIARQRKTLEKLRDTLLPKLMSGEVRVAI
jgi:type I restriction enzyme S subunit